MNEYAEWNRKKASGTFRRSVLKNRASMLTTLVPPADCIANTSTSALAIAASPILLSPNELNNSYSDKEANQLNEELAENE